MSVGGGASGFYRCLGGAWPKKGWEPLIYVNREADAISISFSVSLRATGHFSEL
jgi:hypothetical protein